MFNIAFSHGKGGTASPNSLATDQTSPQLTDTVSETGQYNSRTPTSKTRKIGRALLVIPKLLLSSVTIPLCTALEIISGYAAGVIFGALTLFHTRDYGGLEITIPALLLFVPFSLFLGTAIAVVGLIVGPYDGAHLGWNCDVSKLKTTYSGMLVRIKNYAKNASIPEKTKETSSQIPTIVYPIR